MPWGYLVGRVITAMMVGLTIRSPRRPWIAARATFAVASGMNEMPVLSAALLVGSTALTVVDGNALPPVSVAGYVLAALSLAGLAHIAVRGIASGAVVASAQDLAFGIGWHSRSSASARQRLDERASLLRGLLVPFLTGRPGVRRIGNIACGQGRNQVLDCLVGLRQGWVVTPADYRLRP